MYKYQFQQVSLFYRFDSLFFFFCAAKISVNTIFTIFLFFFSGAGKAFVSFCLWQILFRILLISRLVFISLRSSAFSSLLKSAYHSKDIFLTLHLGIFWVFWRFFFFSRLLHLLSVKRMRRWICRINHCDSTLCDRDSKKSSIFFKWLRWNKSEEQKKEKIDFEFDFVVMLVAWERKRMKGKDG